jgi:hypothetical protein
MTTAMRMMIIIIITIIIIIIIIGKGRIVPVLKQLNTTS